MMLMRRNTCPVDYSLCDQTVTVYRKTGEEYIRTVYDRAFLDFRKTQTTDKTGSKESNSFLLIIPGDTQSVFPKDKVFHGVGPVIDTAEKWRSFVPAEVTGLVVVDYVDPKYWNGKLVHTEAGG